jgi:hypothetical protein
MKAIALGLALLAMGAAASAARADGLPVLGVDVGADGVTVPAADSRYVALPAPTGTLVARIQLADARVTGYRYLPGNYTVPAVAYDGTPGGLSADAKTLVLLEPRAAFPRARTRLAVLDALTLKRRGHVTLRGDFSFDAVSPDGALLYLVHYLSPRDPTRYEVRAYDLERGRLLPEPVVDPREPGEEMRGIPLTRAASADGRWAYTLYGGTGEPFVHALDTAGLTARCIDLDALAGRDLNGARLALSGGTLAVRMRGRVVAAIDTHSLAVREAVATATPARGGDGAGVPWLPLLAAVALVAVVGAGIASFSRGLGTPQAEE